MAFLFVVRFSVQFWTFCVLTATSGNLSNNNYSNVNASNRLNASRKQWSYPPGELVAGSGSGPIDILLKDDGSQQVDGGWTSLSPTVKRRTSRGAQPIAFRRVSSSDASD